MQLATTRILLRPAGTAAAAVARPWLWPLPRLDGDAPCIVSRQDPTRGNGLVVLGYPDRTASAELVPVFAPQDGVITYATPQQGGTVCLDHHGGWSTLHSGLETVLAASTDRFSRRRKSRVRAGDVLGYVRKVLRLGFGLYRWVDGEWTTADPAATCHSWAVQPWFTESTVPASSRLAI
jgi:murein DD-endopeptidase MepM/ murein hydrolase activator NlpD